MRESVILLVFLLLAGSPAAQRKLVIPRGFGSMPGNHSSSILLDRTKPALPRGIQAVFRSGSKGAGKVTALSFRPRSNLAWGTPKFSATLTLGFSTYTKRIVDVDPVLSRNRGKDHVVVFKGTVAFPAVLPQMRKVSAFVFRIEHRKSKARLPAPS